MKTLSKLLVMTLAPLLVACSSIRVSDANCPPTPKNLEWYTVNDNGEQGVYLPEQSFKDLQHYIAQLKLCSANYI